VELGEAARGTVVVVRFVSAATLTLPALRASLQDRVGHAPGMT
jgi:hypothetical protein